MPIQSQQYDPFLDELIWGGENIAIAANVKDKKGKPNVKKTFRLLNAGILPARKVQKDPTQTRGGRYVTTRRALLGVATPE
jgi:hypothetical protein